MKTKILSGLICCLGILSANAQTITAPVGQSLTVTNPIDVTGTGNSINIPVDGAYKIGGTSFLKVNGTNFLIGDNTGNALTTGSFNFFQGSYSGYVNTTGQYNVFSGVNAGRSNTVGSFNVFSGGNSGYYNTSGSGNMFFGTYSGFNNTTGSNNNFSGSNAGYSNTTGEVNVFFGQYSGYSNTTGNYNVFLGGSAGAANTTGSGNTYIGFASTGSPTVSNSTAIGTNASVTASNTVVLGNAATTITGQGLAAGASGLRFANLNASSAAVASGGSNKVLSVDGSGNVVLVALAGGVTTTATNPVAESTWKNADGYLYNNSTNGVVINGAGLDGNALIVKGGVLSKEVNVKVEGAESWPDYVFKPSYKRMSLEEVEKFISINGHLPNVASATEMAATGNNLNKTDIKLLEKVEELTLYLLDMKKANDAQSAEIQSLKNQMNKLKKNRK